MSALGIIIQFLISLVISALIIYLVAKLFGEKEGFGTALLAALAGSVIYAIAFYFLGATIWSTIIGGVAWLIALGSMYNMGWLKSLLIAVVIWIVSAIIGLLFPTLSTL